MPARRLATELPRRLRSPRLSRLARLQPLALASLLALGASGLNAAPRVFAGPGSFWDVVANWTGGIVPGAADDALLGAFNTEVRTSFTINSFTGTGALTVSAGTLTFASASSIGTLNLTGGNLAGAGSLAVAGASTWTAGGMSGTGTTTFGSTLALSGNGVKDITNGRTVNFNGTTTWTNASAGQGRIRTGSSATLNNNGTWLDQSAFNNNISQDFGGTASAFNNAGTYSKSGAGTTNIAIGFNNTRTVAGTGVVDVTAGSLLLTGGGTSNGSFTGAAGTTLGFGGNHTLQAASSVSTAGSVDFSSGTNTVAGSFNAGTATSFSGGTTTFSGTVSGVGSTITANGGTGVFNNTQAFSVSGLVLTSGGLTFNNTGGVTTGSLNLAGGTLAGTSAVTVSGATTWTGGTMTGSGTTTLTGAVALSTSSTKDITNGRIVNFNGTTTWVTPAVPGTPGTPEANGGRIRTGNNATLNNNGTWLDLSPQDNFISPDFGGPVSTFVNAGVYTKSGAGTTAISTTFNNTRSTAGTGVVNLNAGSLQLTGGGTSNGSFVGVAGTTLEFGGNHTLQASSSIDTAGSVNFSSGTNTMAGSFNAGTATRFSGGTTTFSGTVSGVGSTITASGGFGVFNNTQAFSVSGLVLSSGNLSFNNTGGVTTSSLNLTGGTLAGSSSVTVSGSTTWTSGTMTGSGTTTLNTDLALNTAGLKDITNGRTVNFNGTTTWTTPTAGQGRIRTGNSATLNNNGTWLDQNALNNSISQDFGGPTSTFVNAGVYTKSGAGATSINIAFNNTRSTAGTGVVNVDAGRLLLEGGGTSNGSFTGAGSLEFNGGTFALLAASSVSAANVVFSSGTANVAGSYNVATSTRFSGGTANFTGTVAHSGGTLSFTTGGGTANFSNTAGAQFSSLTMAAGTIGGTQAVSFAGASTWSAGGMSGAGTTHFNSDVALTTAGTKDITNGRTVNFNGTTTWVTPAVPGTPGTPEANGGRIRTGSNATLNNNGTWLDRNPQDIAIAQDFGGVASTFVNAGVYTKSGAGTTQIAVAFNNAASAPGTGVVNINAGRLQLSGGGTSNGSFTGPGTLEFNGGTKVLQAGSSVSTPNVVFSGGTTNVAGSYNVATSTQFSGGTANFTGNVANSGGALSFTTGGGTANFNNTAGVQFSSLSMAAGTIGGAQLVSFTGPSTWLAGNMTGAGTTTFASTLALNSAGLKDVTNGRIVNFNGTTTWAAGRLRTGSSATLRNNGTWLDQNAVDAQVSQDFGGTTSTFVNAGVYTKTSTGTTSVGIAFDNTPGGPGTGVFNLDAGRLLLSGGGSSTGSFALAAGTTLEISGVGYTLGGSLSGAATSRLLLSSATVTNTSAKTYAGQLEIAGGTLSNTQSFAAANLLLTSGTVTGAGAFNVSGPVTWTTGTMTGAGTTTFAGNVALAPQVNSTALKDVSNGRIVNFDGTTTWTGGRIRTGSNATLNNNGTWLDQNTTDPQISQDFGGPASRFNNAGVYTKSGASTTAIAIAFNNTPAGAGTGVVNLEAGQLQLSGGGSNSGRFAVAGGATLAFTGSDYTLGGSVDGVAGSRLLLTGGTVTNTTAKTFGGLLEITGGTFSSGQNFTAASLLLAGGTVAGTGTLTVSGPATWTAGAMTAAGTTTFAGNVALAPQVNSTALKDVSNGRIVNFNGTTTWTAGRIRTGSNATLNNNGTWLDQNTTDPQISQDFGGPASNFVNAGTYTKSGAATTAISIGFNNSGTVNVNAGTLTLTGGLGNFSGSTLTGGQFNVTGPGTFSFSGANVVTNAAGITLDGAGSQFLNATNSANGLANFATNAATGSFTIRNGRNFTSASGFSNAGTVTVGSGSTFTTGGGFFTNQNGGLLGLAGGTVAGAVVANAGTVQGFGTVANTVSNTGTLRASGGTLSAPLAVQGATGLVQVASGAALNLSASTVGSSALTLALEGDGAGPAALALGAQNFSVFGDYTNAGFGSGNSFDARAGVSGTGLIVGVNAAQALTGDVQASGPNAWVLDFGTVRGGTTATRSFQIANTGTGASIRGALQTGTPGLGSLDDPRLSGNGTVAANFGAIAAGSSSGSFSITLDATGNGGALTGQSLAVASNFGNVATQTVTLGGFSTVLARGAATPAGPLDLGNFRVDRLPAVSTTLAVSNTTTGAGAERLGLASATATGNFSATSALGSGLVLPGATASDAVTLASSGGTVGVNEGSVALQFTSNGQLFDASFTQLATNLQTVAVRATGFLTAQPTLPAGVALGNFRTADGASSAFTLTNSNAAPAGFQEVLNASAGATTAGVTLGGAVTGLVPGASSNAFVIGFAPGGPAGPRSGSGTVNLVSDGTGTSGLGLLSLPGGTVAVSGTAFNLAVGAATPTPVVVPNQRVGGVGNGLASVALNIANTAPAGSFSEALNASFASLGGDATSNGGNVLNLAAGASNGSAMVVSLNNAQAGARSGSVTLAYASDGTGPNGNSGLAAVAAGSQTLQLSGDVYRLAQASAVSPGVVNLGNVRAGGVLTQLLTLSNLAAADGYSERLNATIEGTPGLLVGGSFSGLAAGASSSALFVGFDTSAPGAKNGTATLTLASDGTGTSGFSPFVLGTQTVNVSASVYRLAGAGPVTPNPVVLAPQREGGTLTQALTLVNTAAADGFSESLNATISADGTATAGGSVNLLAAGATSNALFVGVDTSTAGPRGGTATVALFSDGTGGSGFGALPVGTQVVSVSGDVFRLAQASLVPASVTLADQRVGGALRQGLVLSNTAAADGYSERLNASLVASGDAIGSGSFSLLAAGASSSALAVGVDTGTAGAKAGAVLVNLASDGAGTSGFAPFSLASQTVSVIGNVYRLAVPVVDTTPIVRAARVGDAPLQASIGVSNNAPDAFTERLNASIAAAPSGVLAGPGLVGLQPNASGSLGISLPTATPGSFSGAVGVALVSSSAGTTSGAPDAPLGTVNVAFDGRVYAPAVAQLPATVVNFGTVRVGDVLAPRTLTVANTASGALTDTLQASLSGGNAPFTASGSVAGIAAGASSGSALQVQLATDTAGVFSSAAVVQLRSQNPDLPDLPLPAVSVQLEGQVNNLAQPLLTATGGSGSFSGGGLSYTLDFGTVLTNPADPTAPSGSLLALLGLGNAATGPADALAGSWNLAALAGGPFSVSGFDAFAGLAAGAAPAALTVSFSVATEGSFSRTVVLNGFSTNGSGPDLALGAVTLELQGTVVAVPEPGTYLMMAVGVLAMGSIARRKLRAQRG